MSATRRNNTLDKTVLTRGDKRKIQDQIKESERLVSE